MTQLLDTSKLEDVSIHTITYIDDIVGLGEKKLSIDRKHFDDLEISESVLKMHINRASLEEFTKERNKELLEYENYSEFDHLNSMVAMLEHDFFSIDKVKFFFRDENHLSGEAVIDTSDEEQVKMTSEVSGKSLILTIELR